MLFSLVAQGWSKDEIDWWIRTFSELPGGSITKIERDTLRPDGSRAVLSGGLYRILGSQPPNLRGLMWVEDVTSTRRLERELSAERERLAQAVADLRPLELFFQHSTMLY